ncbi:DEAD/DEAH box helicase family protein [Williamsia sterculiae]|uniref:RNA polymerase primary sigma factor n=1 Tax=Williamsia sterculiae TaxID=1344003 RepID=A0A1N7HBA9_9NOCA|nr:DEAD/DEAH box helicase family protein [Williamsia sterculiae]SIS21968.1 RNA polymerase primary sigma factor [Williamsia sterculiae]
MTTSTLVSGTLRAWQQEALDRWNKCDRRAVVEAVTGTGKTTLGIHAAADALDRGLSVLVAVPGNELVNQWHRAIGAALPSARVGRRGDGYRDTFSDHDIIVSTVHSAITRSAPRPSGPALLVADEVHRYGASSFSRLLSDDYNERLGLTATFERSDNGVAEHLLPYFKNVLFGCDYLRGRSDGVLAPVRVMLVAVPLTPDEQSRYSNLDEIAKKERFLLTTKYGCRAEPFGHFMLDVQTVSDGLPADPATRSAWTYLQAFSRRRELLAQTQGKVDALRSLAPVLRAGGRTLAFSETKQSAQIAAETLLDEGVLAAPYTSDLKPRDRIQLLDAFRFGEMTALVAPKVLDEGVDVPEADVGIILASSKSRRQMIQRMGRIIRPKADGRTASFLVFFARGTSEDPANGAHETFLEDLTAIAEEVLDVAAIDAVDHLADWLRVKVTQTEPEALVDNDVRPVSLPIAERLVHERVNDSVDDQPLAEGEHIRAVIQSVGARPGQRSVDIVLSCLGSLPPDQVAVLLLRYGLAGDAPAAYTDIAAIFSTTTGEVKHIEQRAVEALSQGPEADILLASGAVNE